MTYKHLIIGALFLLGASSVDAATLALSPSSQTIAPGQTATISVILNTAATPISGVDVFLNYNASLVRVEDDNATVSGVQITPKTLMPVNVSNSVSGGQIQFSQVTAGTATYTGQGTLATFRITALTAGTVNINFLFTLGSGSDSNVASSAGQDVLTQVTNGTYTISSVTPSTKFVIGDRVRVTSGPLNVRSSPSATALVLGNQATGVLGTVVGGPTYADNYHWWNINYDSGADGWSVETYLEKPPPPLPTVTFTASPTTLVVGQSSTLTWSSTYATSCTASGGWTGTKAVSGTQLMTPSVTTTYTIACTNVTGTVTKSVSITVTAPAPTVTFSVSPASITAGQSSTLTWSSTNSTSCTASGGWTGAKVISGTQVVNPTVNTTYTIACSGTGGTATKSVSIAVTAAPLPTVAFSASLTTINSGQSSTLTWSSTNSTSCTASGGWTGAKAISGTQAVSPTVSTTYTLTCSGAGGTVSRSVTVTVSGSSDTTAPTAAISSPTTAALVSGTTNISATATDNVGVSKVEFYVDGTLKGTDTSSPYMISWDTTNGGTHACGGFHTHNLTAKAHDAAGNIGTSPIISVNMESPSYCTTRFKLNDRVRVMVGPLNVRSSPSTSGTLLGTQPVDALGTVIGGPTIADGYYWWNINYDTGVDGWSADEYLVLYSAPPPAPTLSFSASPTTISTGQSSTLSWSTTNATDCTAYIGWTGTKATSGSQIVSPTANTEYSLACTGNGGTVIKNVTVNVVSLTASVTTNKALYGPGETITITVRGGISNVEEWIGLFTASSQDSADIYTESSGYDYFRYLNGSTSTPPATPVAYPVTLTFKAPAAAGTYNIRYFANNGLGYRLSVSPNFQVVVLPPVVNLAASPTSIVSGQSSTLTWSSNYADSCTASVGWTGTKTTSGTQSVSPTATTTFALACTGPGGTTSKNVVIGVSGGGVVISGASLVLSPATQSIGIGQIATLSILLNTDNKPISGVDVLLTYNPSLVSVQDENSSVSGVQIKPGTLMPVTVSNSVASGKIQISQVTSGTATYTGQGTLATFRIKTLVAGTANINFSFTPGSGSDSNIASGGQDILAGVMNGTYSISTTGGTTTPPASTKFVIGDRVQVTGTGGSLLARSCAGTTCIATGSQPDGVFGTVTGGPTYANNMWWWQIDYYTGADGWSAENYLTLVTSSQDSSLPQVSITSPQSGDTISGLVDITASASDNTGIASVQFQLNSEDIGPKFTSQPYRYTWNTTLVPNGSYSLVAIARDTAGNETVSSVVNITVENSNSSGSLSIGDRIKTTSRLNIRSGPSTSYPILSTAALGAYGMIISGPVQGNNTWWWEVDFETGRDGWVVEDWIIKDVKGPVITSVRAASMTEVFALISWATDEYSDTTIEYGTGTSYGTILSDDTPTRAHKAGLVDLAPGTVYNFRVTSQDSAGNISISANYTFTTKPAGSQTDFTSPTGSVSSPAVNTVIGSSTYITVAAKDNVLVAGVRLTVDGAGVGDEDTISPFKIFLDAASLTDGSYVISATIRDSSDNTAVATPRTIIVDNTKPVVSSVAASTSIISFAYRAQITWITDELSSTEVEYGTSASYSVKYTNRSLTLPHKVSLLNLLPGTTYHYRVRSRDKAGNITESQDLTFQTSPDNTPPEILSVSARYITPVYALITWTTKEKTDSEVEYGPTASYGKTSPQISTLSTSHSVALTGLSPSTLYHYRVKSRDYSGNQTISPDFTFTTIADSTDFTNPIVTVSFPKNNAIIGAKTKINAVVNDNVRTASVQFKIDGQNLGPVIYISPYTYLLDTATVSAGTHSISAVAMDSSGNTSESLSVNVVVDNVPPAIAALSVVPNSITSALVTWATDEPGTTQIEYGVTTGYGLSYMNSMMVLPHSATLLGLVPGKTYHLRAISRDKLGNIGTSQDVVFTTPNDTVLPLISVSSLRIGAVVRGIINVAASVKDNYKVVGVQFKLDGQNLGIEDSVYPYSIFWDTTKFVNGLHTISATARDYSGNIQTSAPVQITVDNTSPTISAPLAQIISPTSVRITWTTNEPATGQIEYGTTSGYGSKSSPATALTTAHVITISGLQAGSTYHYRIISKDKAGNTGMSGDLTW